MGFFKNFFISMIVVVLTFAGVFIFEDLNGIDLFSPQVGYSDQAANSTVYVQNGVSGVVTLNDPFQGKNFTISISNDPIASGSGVIVNSNGYIITAFHVIGDPNTLINNNNQLKLMDQNDINNYLEEAAVTIYMTRNNPQLGNELLYNETIYNSNFGYSENNIQNMVKLLEQRNLISVTSSKQDIKVKLPFTNNFLDASLVDVGDPNSNEDIALLKVNSNNLPALTVNSHQPATRENLRIYGYPGNTTDSKYINSTVNPSSTAGFIQSQIRNDFNILYYESTAQATEGYSGGPVIDHQNAILGIIIYSIETQSRFKKSTNSSVFLSSQYIIQICNKNQIPININ